MVERQQKLSSKGGNVWRTRTVGSPGQIGLRFHSAKRTRHVIGPSVKTRSLNHKLILPTREGEGRKPREIKPKETVTPTQIEIDKEILEKLKEAPNLSKEAVVDQVSGHKHSNTLVQEEYEKLEKQGKIKKQPKAVKVGKKKREHTGMTHLERMHLLSQAKELELDPQEIDSKIGYYENKKHLEELARHKGVSEEELHGKEAAISADVASHEEYLHSLRNELEAAGYTVPEPEGI
jgi:hypothetical protein